MFTLIQHIHITVGVLQSDTLEYFLFIICLDYILRKSLDLHHDLGVTLFKKNSSRYQSIKIINVDYADDLVILTDTLKDATKLLHVM